MEIDLQPQRAAEDAGDAPPAELAHMRPLGIDQPMPDKPLRIDRLLHAGQKLAETEAPRA